MAFFGLLCSPLLIDNIRHRSGMAHDGVIDLHATPLDRPVALGGTWRFRWQSGGPLPAGGGAKFLKVPGRWSDRMPDGRQGYPSRGSASYEAILRGLAPGRYTLFVASNYAATQVRIDGRVVSQRGKWSADPAQAIYQVQSHTVNFAADGQDTRVAIDVATGQHRDAGIPDAPVLGKEDQMARWSSLNLAKNFLFAGSIILLSIFGIIVHIFRRHDLAHLYFASSLLAFFPVQAIFSHINLLVLFFPEIGFRGMAMLQYGLGTPALMLMLAYVDALFPQRGWGRAVFRVVQVLMVTITAVLLVLIAFVSTYAASVFSQAAEPVRTLSLLFIIVISFRAALRRADGAIVFLLGISLLLASIIIRLLVANAAIDSDAISFDPATFGIMAFLIAQVIILAERWSASIHVAEQTVGELRQLLEVNTAVTNEMDLEQLLEKIVNALTGLVNADRSSLFLHDPATGELWSLVAEGLTDRKIRISADSGIAGHVFRSGEVINVNDAYAHPAFNTAVDRQTGIRTRALLTVPITTRDGRTLGVMQALNQASARRFSERDVARIKAFAAQAAVAIDNATLFSEVVAERNYNESILRSMSSGVITLDAEAKVVKLNQTACRILGLPQEALDGINMKALLNQYYPQLTAEIDLVASTGQSRDILDFEIQTAGPSSISVNISIVPLRLEQVAAGVLIILEDITEGKRLQGTMRRFMSQEVVDQVLQRDGELLFGSSCPASILFCDIRNFTTMSERLDPRQTVGMLNEIFTELFEDIAVTGGILDKYIGDAIMATFGAPIHSGQDPQNAVRCALAMLESLERINTRRVARNEQGLRLGLGIASGDVVAGTIGSPKRMEYTVIGDAVNLASRLQDLTKTYDVPVIVCETTARHVQAAGYLRELDYIRVRGRSGALSIFQLVGKRHANGGQVEASYAEGRRAMAEMRWPDAIRAFERAMALDPDDGPSSTMAERARTLAANPPIDWDGAWPPRLRSGA